MSNLLDTKTNILALALEIGGRDAYNAYVGDENRMSEYFDEVITELAKSLSAPFMDATQIRALDSTSVYSYPTGAERLEAVFFDTQQLSKTNVNELEALSSAWRTDEGTPFAWTQDRTTARTFQIYPMPDANGDTLPGTLVWGSTFPSDDLALIYTESRENDLADWAALYVAYSVLSREFSRISDHQDIRFSKLCDAVASLTASIAGIPTAAKASSKKE